MNFISVINCKRVDPIKLFEMLKKLANLENDLLGSTTKFLYSCTASACVFLCL